jgi:hypothetical protein
MIVEIIGIIMIIVSIIVLYPYTKEKSVEKGKVPFDRDRLK